MTTSGCPCADQQLYIGPKPLRQEHALTLTQYSQLGVGADCRRGRICRQSVLQPRLFPGLRQGPVAVAHRRPRSMTTSGCPCTDQQLYIGPKPLRQEHALTLTQYSQLGVGADCRRGRICRQSVLQPRLFPGLRQGPVAVARRRPRSMTTSGCPCTNQNLYSDPKPLHGMCRGLH